MQHEPSPAAGIAAALGAHAEAVCRRYLPLGRKLGRYWVAGELDGARGRSLFVRLPRPRRTGKWTDAANGQHGDLLDLIRYRSGAPTLTARPFAPVTLLSLCASKTGARAVPLSPTARQVLASLPRQPDNPWVISGRGPGARLSNLNATWGVVRKKAGLDDVRIHDLRHSYASRALSLGESLPMIGKLLGHRKVQTTARYAHLARDSVKAAAERVSDSLAADLDTPPNVSAGA